MVNDFRISKLDLLMGGYIEINGIFVKHPTLQEVCDYGEDNYYNAIGLFANKPYDLRLMLYESGKLYTDVDDYELFLGLFQSETYGDNWKWIIGDYNFQIDFNKDNNQFILHDYKRKIIIDKLVYYQISQLIRDINMMSNEKDYNPGDVKTQKFILEREFKKAKRKKNKKETSILKRYISTIVWSKFSSYTYDNIWKLSMYQFFDALDKISTNDHRENMMLGLYTGNIDTTKNPINMDKIDLFK